MTKTQQIIQKMETEIAELTTRQLNGLLRKLENHPESYGRNECIKVVTTALIISV